MRLRDNFVNRYMESSAIKCNNLDSLEGPTFSKVDGLDEDEIIALSLESRMRYFSENHN